MSRAAALYPPSQVVLREVGLRDGLQLVRTFPDTAAKRRWLIREHAAGVRYFELGSFLPAARMPQFADIAQVIETARGLRGLHGAALTLNERGVADALAAGIDELVCVVSATEEHSQANMRRSRAAAVDLVAHAARQARAAGPDRPLVSAGIAMAFGCSIAGAVAPDTVLGLVKDCLAAGADLVGLADTVGFAGPHQVADLTARAIRLAGETPVSVHLHDTRGLGLANAAAALDAGCRVLDGALGGLGGCPFAPGASGNVVFEDLAFLCDTMGIDTGIDLTALIGVRAVLEDAMPDEPLFGALARSGPPPRKSRAA